MSLETYTLTAQEQHKHVMQARVQQLIRIRWLYIVPIGFGSVGLLTLTNVHTPAGSNSMHILFLVGALGFNALLWWLARIARSVGYYKVLAILQVGLDIVLAAYGVYVSGAAHSRAIIFYAIPIVTSAIVFTRTFVYTATVVASVSFSGLVLLYNWHYPGAASRSEVVFVSIFYPFLFFVIATVVAYLTSFSTTAVRQESYEELLALLTHKLRQPSSTIAAALDMLEHDADSQKWTDSQKHAIALVKKENIHSLDLISSLLETARNASTQKKRAAQLTAIDLVPLLKSSAESVAETANRTADLRFDLAEPPVKTMATAEQLRVAFHKLLTNSFAYSQPGTPVTVKLQVTSGECEIEIIDKGKGMNDAEQAALFQPPLEKAGVAALHDPSKIGLGFYISKHIIEHSGGTVHVESRSGEGTTVIIRLKRSADV